MIKVAERFVLIAKNFRRLLSDPFRSVGHDVGANTRLKLSVELRQIRSSTLIFPNTVHQLRALFSAIVLGVLLPVLPSY